VDVVFTIKIINPERNNTSRALSNLLSESMLSCKNRDNLQVYFKKWAKDNYNYNIEYTRTKNGTLSVHIDTEEMFFVLKHG
jgi:hypothetical protein